MDLFKWMTARTDSGGQRRVSLSRPIVALSRSGVQSLSNVFNGLY